MGLMSKKIRGSRVQRLQEFNRQKATMGLLSTKRRAALPESVFGLPGSRKYPMPDASHAATAKARATQMVKAGKLSPSSAQKVRAKANKVLGK